MLNINMDECLRKSKSKIQAAYTNLVLASTPGKVYFGGGALRLQPVPITELIEDPNIPGRILAVKHGQKFDWFATDGRNLFYNPATIAELNISRIEAMVAHEAGHMLLGQLFRAKGLNQKWANVAGDMALNPILKEAGFDVDLENWVYDDAPDGKLRNMEQIYRSVYRQDDNGNGHGDPDPNGGIPGNGTDPGRMLDTDTPVDTVLETEWLQAAITQSIVASQYGKLPGAIKRMLRELKEPKINPREVLHRFLTDKAKVDYTWSKPNMRYAPMGLYLPPINGVQLGEIAVLWDTSGSIGDQVTADNAAFVGSVLSELTPEKLTVIYGDSRVTQVEVFEPGDEIRFNPKGGGGTDFRPLFDAIEKECPDIKACVFLTDMCGTYPEHEPNYPVIWLDWAGIEEIKPPFGEHLVIKGA